MRVCVSHIVPLRQFIAKLTKVQEISKRDSIKTGEVKKWANLSLLKARIVQMIKGHLYQTTCMFVRMRGSLGLCRKVR